jgi:DNA polymerase III delta prime subunit
MAESNAKKLEPAFSFFYHPQNLGSSFAFDRSCSLDLAISYAQEKPNERQEKAVEASFQNPLSLLWGPPGTGKTWTLALLICSWLEMALKNKKSLTICVGAANYNAIDTVLIEVAKFLARRSKQTDEPITVYRLRSTSSEPLEYAGVTDVSILQSLSLLNILESKTGLCVVGGTFMQLLNLSKKKNSLKNINASHWFDLLVLDEASQITTAVALSYAILLKPHSHMIVCGDDKQLGPVQQFEVGNKRDGLLDCVFSYFKNSHKITPSALSLNYRSNDEISGWPSERFYANDYASANKNRILELEMGSGSQPNEWPSTTPWSSSFDSLLSPESPIAVVTYEDKSCTVSNLFEASIAAALIRTYYLRLKATNTELTVAQFWTKHAGLVTPHRAQIATIRNLLGPDLMPADGGLSFIDTVDRFQGQERDLIVACYTVSDTDFIASEESFILSARRFNVTLTRAKSKFILLVSQSLLSHLPQDAIVAEDASHLQLFVGNYCKPAGKLKLPYSARGLHTEERDCEYFTRELEISVT